MKKFGLGSIILVLILVSAIAFGLFETYKAMSGNKDFLKVDYNFKKREQAEQFKKEQILLLKLHKWAEEHNAGWTFHENNTFNFYVIYKNSDKKLDVSWCSSIQSFTKLPYFKSDDLAEQFIEEFGDEIKEVFC